MQRETSEDWTLRTICALLALLSVAPLLAWVLGFGTFATWYRFLTAPALVVLALIAVRLAPRRPSTHLRTAFVTGAMGGLLGTVGYDVVRIPFVLLGNRLLAPIDSYGVLLLDASSSSAWSGVAGWMFHASNGVCFGIAYAMIALGWRWWWGLAWGMVLETATIVTPFASDYGIRGKWALIGVAYGAHVAYGVPLGRLVERPERTMAVLRETNRRAATYALLGVVIGLLAWHKPWSTPDRMAEGTRLAAGPSAVIQDGRFSPNWLRVPPGGCAVLRNDDDQEYLLQGADGSPLLSPGRTESVCFSEPGVHRVRTSNRPYAGGFVIVDDQLARTVR